MANVMSNRGTEQQTPGVGGWIALVSTGILCAATLVTTVWVLWKYVPAQAAALADLGAPLPLSTRISIAASHWFVRMLPFAIVASVLLGPLLLGGATVAMLALEPWWWRAARAFIVAGLVVSVLASGAIVLILASLRAGFLAAGSGP